MAKKVEKRGPDIRFKGFTDDWEQRKLKDISKRILRKNKDLQSTLPLTISAQDGLVDQTTYFNKQVAGKQLRNYLLLLEGEFAYNKSYSVGYPYGAIKRLDKYNQGVLSTLYLAFKPQNINSGFLQHYYDTDKWYREIYQNSAEGARNHGLLNISADDFFHTKLKLPGDNKEQVKIAEFLDCFDNFIDLQQKKLGQLKLLKKAMLQQMFANYDNNVPNIRFKNFNGKWELQKGKQLFKSKSNKGYPELPVLSATQDKGMIPRDTSGIDIKFNHKSLSGYKKVEPGDFIIHLRSFQGGFAFSSIEGIASPAYKIFTFVHPQSFDNYFWKEKFTSYNFIQLLKKVTYGVRDGRSISYSDFLTLNESFPSSTEQKEIGKLLRKLEELLNIQESKFNQFAKIKKYLLQKMFV